MALMLSLTFAWVTIVLVGADTRYPDAGWLDATWLTSAVSLVCLGASAL